MRPFRRLIRGFGPLELAYVLLTLAFLVILHWPSALQRPAQWLDQRLVAAGYSLSAPPKLPVRIGIAEIPTAFFDGFVESPSDHPLAQRLIELHQQGVKFHVYLPRAFAASGFTTAQDFDRLLSLLDNTGGEHLSDNDFLGRLERLKRWANFKDNSAIFWFLPRGQLIEGGGTAISVQSSAVSWSPSLFHWFVSEGTSSANYLRWSDGRYTFLGADESQIGRLWNSVGEQQTLLTAPLIIVQQYVDLGSMSWANGRLHTSKADWSRWVNRRGTIPVDLRLAPVVLPMSDVISRLDEFDLLLVAEQGNIEPWQSAATINTLMANHYPKSPAWASAWNSLFLLILALTTAVIWLRANSAILVLSLLLLTTLLVALQFGAQVYYQWWLPVGAGLLFCWCATALRLIQFLINIQHNRVRKSWRMAWQQILREQINTGKLAEAENNLTGLAQCRVEPWQLQTTYDIAQSYEKQRRYDQAEKLYLEILSRSSSFSDVKSRLKRLHELSNSQGGGLDATLVIDEQIINKPVLGRYEIQKELGRGAMGVVYLGRDPKISRMVAIKTLHYKHFEPNQLPDVKARFFREAEAAGRLSHPNIVSVFDVGEESDLAFIAMDYVPGKALNYFTHPKRLLPVHIVYGLMAKAADALFYAHKNNIIHRDIKPSNLLYDPETGRMKVSDFGIARLVDNSKTRTGDVMGSPLYMSPEQLKGTKVTEAADIYSLGVTMYQLLTGKLPFDGDSLANLTYQILQGKHASVRTHRPDLPPSATRITNKALQKDPNDRFVNAREMAEAIRKSLARDFE